VVLLGSKAIPQGGPLQRGRISVSDALDDISVVITETTAITLEEIAG
jgi:hypothetical protein